MLKLKLQYFGHLMWRVDLLEKTLMQAGIGGRRRRGEQRMRWLDCITDLMDLILSELCELVMDREAWHTVIYGVTRSQTWLSDWTELMWGSHSVVSDTLLPLDCSLPTSSVYEILQARILEWVAIPFSRGSSWFRNWIQVSYTAGRFLTVWDTREDTINPAMLYLKTVFEIIH